MRFADLDLRPILDEIRDEQEREWRAAQRVFAQGSGPLAKMMRDIVEEQDRNAALAAGLDGVVCAHGPAPVRAMSPLHESAEVSAMALASEQLADRCNERHPNRPIRCHRTRGHTGEGYMGWHEARDTVGNTYRWR